MDAIRMPVVHMYGTRLREHARWETITNQSDLAQSYICACAVCGHYFFPEEIRKWSEQSALCPVCGERGVIGDACHLPLTPGFLRHVRGNG